MKSFSEENIKKNILNITNNYYKYLMNLENVIGVGMGYKRINNIYTNEICIHVLVIEKVKESYLSSNNIIPKTYMGIKTDVIKTGIIKICKDINRNKVRPLKGGYGISVRDPRGYWHNGTLGCIVTKIVNEEREYYILSNNHVLAGSNTIPIGAGVIQPSDKHWGHSISDVIAHLTTFEALDFADGSENFMDAAIAKISEKGFISSMVGANILVEGDELEEEILLKGVAKPKLNMEIKKYGMVTGLTNGIITSIGVAEKVKVGKKILLFKNQISADIYNKKGDSGAIILNKLNEVVGLFFAGSIDDKTATFTDIQSVLDKFEVELYVK